MPGPDPDGLSLHFDADGRPIITAELWTSRLPPFTGCTRTRMARAKGVAPSYVSRVPRLTMLAPEFVEAILDGRQPAGLQLDDLLRGFPLAWVGQRSSFGLPRGKQERSETTGPHFAAWSGETV